MTVWTQRLYLSVHVRHPYLKGVLWLLHNFGVPNFCSMSDHLNPLFSAPVRQHSSASLFSSSLSLYLVMQASKIPALEGSSSFYIPYQGMFSKGKINNNIKKIAQVFLLDLVLSSEYLSSLHLDLRGTQACPCHYTKCFPVSLLSLNNTPDLLAVEDHQHIEKKLSHVSVLCDQEQCLKTLCTGLSGID